MGIDNNNLDFLAGGGEMGARIRAMDWSRNPLGPVERWPQSLRSAVSIMLPSKAQIAIFWGEDLITLYNDAYRPVFGAKHPGALGKPIREAWDELWRAGLKELFDGVLTTGDAFWAQARPFFMERHGYLEETYFDVSYDPIRDESGRVGGLFCIVSEVTGRVVGERRLRLLRDLRGLAQQVLTVPEVYRAAAEVLAAYSEDVPFALLYGAERPGEPVALMGCTGLKDSDAPRLPPAQTTEFLELGVNALGRNEPIVTGPWPEPIANMAVVPFAAPGEPPQGCLVAGLSTRLKLDGGYRDFLNLVASTIASAVAAARRSEDERRRAEMLAELDRTKTAFYSNVSHEFRTPLTLMLGPVEDALADSKAALPQTQRERFELVRRSALRLQKLVNTLLDFSRIEAGRMQASYEPTDLAAFTADIASSFRSAIERAGMRLRVDASPLEQPVYVDRDMWEKILLNLLSNAFKFTFAGEIAVSIRALPDGSMAEVKVSDTGIGIAKEELPKLFERFHRVAGAQGRSFEGSGIGLALVHELVRLHGGSISVASTPGQGTTFTLQLPFGHAHLPAQHVRSARSTPIGAPTNAQPYVDEALRWLPDFGAGDDPASPLPLDVDASDRLGAAAGVGKRIVLADDNKDMRDYMRRLLQSQGYEVLAVENGLRAIEAARAANPDLILTDVMMPQLDGFGLLRAIRDDPHLAGVPVIMLSARAGEEAKIEGLDAGADDYLVKPFAARELLARVNSNIQMAMVRRDAARAVMQSEQRFLMTQERLTLALSTGRVAVYDWDVDTDRLSVQGPMAEVFGVTVEDAIKGLPLQVFMEGIHPDDRERTAALISQTVSTGALFEAEYRTLGSGRIRTILSRGRMGKRASGKRFFSGVLIDMTEEKHAEAKLREQARVLEILNAELQTINASLEERVATEVASRLKTEDALRQAQKMEAIGQLTGGVAHDFNNLLTAIIGGLDTIRRSRPDDSTRIQRATNMALQGAQRAAILTSRLLAFSRRQPLEPRPLDINLLVRDMTDLLHRTIGETIELEGVLAPRLWRVEVDQNQLENVVLNLAVNARDAMPEGGKLTIETANTALDESYTATDVEVIPGQYVMLSVSDTGCGMSADILERVFEPFFTTKEAGRGTGLGLSMVYGFVKQSGGHVTVYSEEGQGTTVKLYFPKYTGMADETVDRPDVAIPQASEGEVVLVVEDNQEVRSYSVSILSELGYRVLEAADAEEALRVMGAIERIDLLFTDVILPGKNGRVLADMAMQKWPSMRVLYTTGYSRNAIVHHGRLDAGVQLITKPFTFEQLAMKVRDVLDRRG